MLIQHQNIGLKILDIGKKKIGGLMGAMIIGLINILIIRFIDIGLENDIGKKLIVMLMGFLIIGLIDIITLIIIIGLKILDIGKKVGLMGFLIIGLINHYMIAFIDIGLKI